MINKSAEKIVVVALLGVALAGLLVLVGTGVDGIRTFVNSLSGSAGSYSF
jgi:hypothetical protein